MLFGDGFLIDIREIRLAHEYVLDRVHRCEYPHGRGHYGLVYVVSGRAEYRFYSGERITVSDGNVLFLFPNCAYSIATEKEFKHYTINFDIHEDSSHFDDADQPFCLLQTANIGDLDRIFEKLIEAWSSKQTGYQMRSVGYLYELLSQLSLAYTNAQKPTSYQRLLLAKEYIEQCFNRPITLAYLAFLSNMSVTNFRREWKKRYEESPLQYRDRVRLHYAKEYLNSGYFTVSEIAHKCGFEDVSYFVRFFKKQTGITPGEFKKYAVL